MTTGTDLHIRIDPQLKSEAEAVFSDLGVSPANAVSIFYRQVVIHGGFPFKVVRCYPNTPEFDGMTSDEVYAELKKGMDDYRAGRVRTIDETFEKMRGAHHEML